MNCTIWHCNKCGNRNFILDTKCKKCGISYAESSNLENSDWNKLVKYGLG